MSKVHSPKTDPVHIIKGESLNLLKEDPENTKKTDTAITESVDSVLWNDDAIRCADYHEIDIYTDDQIVYLHGHVGNATNRQRVENAVRSVPGVLGIKNALILDDNLECEVAKALQRMEGEAKVKLFTDVQHGVVTIHGEVKDDNLRALAETCVASVPGVRGILNEVHSPGSDRKTEVNRFLQPSIGEQIYLRDGPSGVVKQVIINPNNRLVVAIVIQKHFSALESTLHSTKNGEVAPAKKLVISAREIHSLSQHAGYPQSQSTEPETYKDFEASDFSTPKKDWIPPYPYASGEVLFPA